MTLEVADRCPGCGIAILHGAILDAASEVERYGPILGLSRDADITTARAAYVGLSSLFDLLSNVNVDVPIEYLRPPFASFLVRLPVRDNPLIVEGEYHVRTISTSGGRISGCCPAAR